MNEQQRRELQEKYGISDEELQEKHEFLKRARGLSTRGAWNLFARRVNRDVGFRVFQEK